MTIEFDLSDRQDGWPLQRVLQRTERGGYVLAEVTPVHAHECKAWRPSASRHGWKCTCGADAAFESLLAAALPREEPQP